MKRRVAFGGGRLNTFPRLCRCVLDAIRRVLEPDEMIVIQGGAQGYDRHCGDWADRNGIESIEVEIDEEKDGSRDDAPKRRNQRLLDETDPEIFVAFVGGPGTRDMIMKCLRRGVKVWEVEDIYGEFFVWEWQPKHGKAKLITKGKIK